jgi:hypothetical protein
MYREIRVENVLTDGESNEVGLKKGAEVKVTIEADTKDTVKKTS